MAALELNDIASQLQEIQHMAEFASGLAADCLDGNGATPGFFQIPTGEGNQLAFCCYDILKRIKELQASIDGVGK